MLHVDFGRSSCWIGVVVLGGMNNFQWEAVDRKNMFDGKNCHWASSLMWVSYPKNSQHTGQLLTNQNLIRISCHWCFTPPRTKVRISPMHFASSSHSAISFNCQLLANTQIRSGMLPVQVSKLNFNVSTSQALRYNGVEKCMCICLVRSQSNNQKVSAIQQSSRSWNLASMLSSAFVWELNLNQSFWSS